MTGKLLFITGGSGIIHLSKDGGDSWDSSATGTDATFVSLHSLKDDRYIFAFGKKSSREFILVRLDGNQITGIERRQDTPPDGFEAIDAYPNPFQDAVTVSFTCTENVPITVRVHSILDIEITRDIMEYAVAGTHYWNWFPKKADQHAASAYVLTMQSGNLYRSKLLTFVR